MKLRRLLPGGPARPQRAHGLPEEVFVSESDQMLGSGFDPHLLRRLLDFVRPYSRPLSVATGLMILTSAASVAAAPLVGRAIDALASGVEGDPIQAWSTLKRYLLLLLLVKVAEWYTNRSRIAILAEIGSRVVVDIRNELFRHLQRLSLSFYDTYKVGRLMSRIIGDVSVMQEFVTWSITGTARAVFTLSFIVIAMLAMNWRLALLSMAVLPVMVVATNTFRQRARDAWREVRRWASVLNGYLNETVSGVRVVQSYRREARNLGRFSELNSHHFDANVYANWLASVFFPLVGFLGSVATASVVAYGAFGDTSISPGELTAFVLLVDRFFEPIRELSRRYNQLLSTMAATERIVELLDRRPEVRDAPRAVEMPRIGGAVRFEGVWFTYDRQAASALDELDLVRPVLRDINLDVPAGTTVALIGETGAGKTSIVNVLARFYNVQRGRITIDGIDTRTVTLESLRSQLGFVPQETFLFSGSLRDNIRYGRLDAGADEVDAAAQAVGLGEFVRGLPEGYDTEVGERGVNLSVGQRQLVAFARALLADPRILILDEATSSVDTQTELVIQRALARLLQGRTAFIIAHRLSTISNADLIVLLDQGRIIEQGRHAELIARRGGYFRLYTMQWRAVELSRPQVAAGT